MLKLEVVQDREVGKTEAVCNDRNERHYRICGVLAGGKEGRSVQNARKRGDGVYKVLTVVVAPEQRGDVIVPVAAVKRRLLLAPCDLVGVALRKKLKEHRDGRTAEGVTDEVELIVVPAGDLAVCVIDGTPAARYRSAGIVTSVTVVL